MAKEPFIMILLKMTFHKRFLEVGNTGCGIWLRLMTYAASQRSDGLIDETVVSLIVPSEERPHFQKLIDKELVEIHPEGYRLRKYLKHNCSRASIEKEIAAESEGGKKSGETRALKKKAVKGEVHPFAAEHHKLYNKYPAWHSGAAYKKWMAYCAENISSQEDLTNLGCAIEAYIEEQKRMARTKGISFSEHHKFIKAPSNFLEDKEDGSEFWRFVLAANDTPIAEKKAADEQKAKKPMGRELLPWEIGSNTTPWPDDEARPWVEERLKGVSEEFRRRWLDAHGLSYLFASEAVAS